MDRNYYYRVLGLRNDASAADISKAYRARIARLNSADYADDAEYVKKKKLQAKHAYEVLTGASAPCSDAKKERRFERYKDAIEAREGLGRDDFIDDGTSERHVKKKRLLESFSLDDLTDRIETLAGPQSLGRTNRSGKSQRIVNKGALVSVIVIICTLLTVVTSAIGIFVFDEADYENLISDINQAQYELSDIDHYAYIDTESAADAEDIDWSMGIGEIGDTEIYYNIDNALSWMNVYYYEDFFDCITGEADFYNSHDDFECAMAFIDWLGAPEFEEVAGKYSEVTGDYILDLGDYMYHLSEVVWEEY